MNTEKTFSPISGYAMVAVVFVLGLIGIAGLAAVKPVFFIFFAICAFMLKGFFFLNPNSSTVLVLFGEYRGTVKSNGFWWVNPFFTRRDISLRAKNFNS